MNNQDYLTLRSFRLKANDEWTNDRSRLSFVFPKGGHGKYVSSSVAYRLVPGDVLVVNASSGGKLGAPAAGEMLFSCFSVCLENLFPLFASHEICLLQSLIDGYERAQLYPASSPLALECHRLLSDVPPRAALEHRSQLLRVVAAILSMEFEHAHQQRIGYTSVERRLIQVLDTLTPAELLNLSIGELAVRFGCSRRHLSRLFQQYFGLPVAALRSEMRLLKAVSLLRNPDSKIIHVAGDCGFNHLGRFNASFKKRFGVSPGRWRKSLEQSDGHVSGSAGGSDIYLLRSGSRSPSLRNAHDSDAAVSSRTQSTELDGAQTESSGDGQPVAGVEMLSCPAVIHKEPLQSNSHPVSA